MDEQRENFSKLQVTVITKKKVFFRHLRAGLENDNIKLINVISCFIINSTIKMKTEVQNSDKIFAKPSVEEKAKVSRYWEVKRKLKPFYSEGRVETSP